MMKVVINADDYGLSGGVCQAVTELLELGAISNTTVMICAPGALTRCRELSIHSHRARFGVHLQLTGGTPVSPAHEVPSLVDLSTGHFLPKERLPYSNPDEVRIEWRRQIETVWKLLGGKPSHLDSHQGAHRQPHLSPIYLELAASHCLPVRGGVRIGQIPSEALGISGSSLSLSEWTGRQLSADSLIELLLEKRKLLAVDQVLEVVSHPGYSDDQLRSVSSLNDARTSDFEALIELHRQRALHRHGFELVSYPF